MNKILVPILAAAMLFGSYGYNGSTTSAVTLVGGIVKAQGTGYYISGDKITKVNCGYCIPDKAEVPKNNQLKEYPKVIVHPPITIQQNCPNGVCPIPKK